MVPVKKTGCSPAWKHFTKYEGGAQCHYCGSIIKFVGTSNLLNHLRNKHLEHWDEIRRKNPAKYGPVPTGRARVKVENTENPGFVETDLQHKKPRVFKRTSVVWKHFVIIDEEKGTVQCIYCDTQVKSFHSTSNLFTHLKKRHPLEYAQGEEAEQKGDADPGDSALDPSTGELIVFDESESGTFNVHIEEMRPARPVRRSTKTPIWKYFSVLDEGKWYKCKICKTVLKAFRNTSNLYSHLRIKHLSTYKLISTPSTRIPLDAPPQPPIEENSESANEAEELIYYEPISSGPPSPQEPIVVPPPKQKKKTKTANVEEINYSDSLINFIVTDDMPINISELTGFRQLFAAQIPEFEMPSQIGLRNLLDTKYNEMTSVFTGQLMEANHFSLAIGEWTDAQSARNFIGVTCHFIEDSELKSATIGFEELTEGSTEDLLVQKIETLCESWNISKDKVESVAVTGATPLIISICTTVFGADKLINCFSHALNLIAKKPFEELSHVYSIVDAIKQITDHLKQGDEIMVEDCEDGQQFWDLIYATPTTWRGLLNQLEHFVKFSDKIEAIQDDRLPHLSKNLLHQIKDIIKVFKPLKAVTDELCQDDHLSTSKVIPLVQCLLASMGDTWPETQVGTETKEAMLSQITAQLSDVEKNDIFGLATLIDPRFKKNYFKNVQTRNESVAKLKELAMVVKEDPFEETVKDDDGGIWKFHKSLVESQSSAEPHPVTMYLSSKVSPLKDTDPIQFFSSNHPELKDAAEKLLVSVATCSPPRIIFSQSGNTINSNWATLPIHDLRRLMFLKSVVVVVD